MITHFEAASEKQSSRGRNGVAKVLLADTDLSSRLSLRSLLVAAGYDVDGAASSAEAVSRLDDRQYQLVLANLNTESDDAGSRVLAYARQKEYRPATALFSSELSQTGQDEYPEEPHREIRISDENVSYFLASVAHMISDRASRRISRSLPASSRCA